MGAGVSATVVVVLAMTSVEELNVVSVCGVVVAGTSIGACATTPVEILGSYLANATPVTRPLNTKPAPRANTMLGFAISVRDRRIGFSIYENPNAEIPTVMSNNAHFAFVPN